MPCLSVRPPWRALEAGTRQRVHRNDPSSKPDGVVSSARLLRGSVSNASRTATKGASRVPCDGSAEIRAPGFRPPLGTIRRDRGSVAGGDPRLRATDSGRLRRSEHAKRRAAAAGLCHVSDDAPGIARRRLGKGWSYHAPDESLIRDEKTRERIVSLAIPPAWTDVWICPDPKGHLQATGRDDRGRKQYRYHPRWREVRDATKFHRMIRFGESLPVIRAGVEEAMGQRSLSREKVLATVVRLLETSCIPDRERRARARERHVRSHHAAKPTRRGPGSRDPLSLRSEGRPGGRGVRQRPARRPGGGRVPGDTRLRALPVPGRGRGAAGREVGGRERVSEDFYVHPGVLDAYETGLLGELFSDGFPEEDVDHMDPAEVALLRLLMEIQKKDSVK